MTDINQATSNHFRATGNFILHGGSLNISNAPLVSGRGDGNAGQDELYMDGGVINKNNTEFVARGEGGGGYPGIVTQAGGIFDCPAPIYLGWNVNGTWNLNGGTAAPGTIWMGINANGTFNLNGGDLTASSIYGGNGVFNFNGGTLHAEATDCPAAVGWRWRSDQTGQWHSPVEQHQRLHRPHDQCSRHIGRLRDPQRAGD